jgi:methylated-DNA-[protein]-cysteine S-methyltransferase
MLQKNITTRSYYKIFNTSIGDIGIVWSNDQVLAIELPAKNTQETEKKLLKKYPHALKNKDSLSWVEKIISRITNHLDGSLDDFKDVPIALGCVSKFRKEVYEQNLKIPAGKTISYKALAEKIKNPKAARAVGNALSQNPCPILIPCHRVIGSDDKLHGFTAHDGISLKKRLLEMEKRDPSKEKSYNF